MSLANSTTAFRGERYSLSVMPTTIADAIADSKRQFTKCYRTSKKAGMTTEAFHVAALRRLVDKAGGPAEFARKHSRDDADKLIDPTYVSQILNGHRSFGEKARRNMATRAGLPADYFEVVRKAKSSAATYDFESTIVEEAVAILRQLPRDLQVQALGAIKIIAAQQLPNSSARAGQ